MYPQLTPVDLVNSTIRSFSTDNPCLRGSGAAHCALFNRLFLQNNIYAKGTDP